ncbi:hypothetical protein WA026_015902 [Henosepilachna vigintioctopunctata]|uniref:Uncharacterized protein n=1 Tax=Henosepilachna vigintioctopunctata TaxID=420089 RepID=A0AAW1UAC7_9CUCU
MGTKHPTREQSCHNLKQTYGGRQGKWAGYWTDNHRPWSHHDGSQSLDGPRPPGFYGSTAESGFRSREAIFDRVMTLLFRLMGGGLLQQRIYEMGSGNFI